MRFEWSDWVRYHRWDQFELLAKSDPSQQLCDTVFELSIGFTDKTEVKKLKKILYILKLAGFEPTDPERLDPEPPKLPKLGGVGIMQSCDPHGWRGYFFGQFIGGEIHGLLVVTLEEYGIVQITPVRFHEKVWEVMKPDLLDKHPAPFKAMVDPAYVLHRIRSAYENRNPAQDGKESKVKLNAYWRQQLQRVPVDFPHPAQNHIIATGVGPEFRLVVMREHEFVNRFRIFIPPDDPLWTEFHTVRWDETLTPEDRQAKYLESLIRERHRLCTDFVVQDMVLRFLDLAYMHQDPNNKEAWAIMHLAEHLQEKRSRSEVFEALLEATARDLEDDIEEDDDDPAMFPQRGE